MFEFSSTEALRKYTFPLQSAAMIVPIDGVPHVSGLHVGLLGWFGHAGEFEGGY